MPVHAQPTHAGRRLSKAGSGGWERSGGGPVDFPAPYPGAAHPGRPWGAAGGGALKESDQRSISPARRFPPLPHLREFEPNPTLPARFASPPPPDRPWPPGGGHLLSSQIAEPDPAFLRSRLADAELALARQEIDGLRRQVSTKQARIAELEEQVSESAVYAKELRSLQRQVDTKQDRIDALESTGNGAKALQWKNDDLQEQLSSANTRIAELKASLRLAETGKQKAAEDLDSVLADTQRAMTLRTEQANVQVALDELRVRHKEMLASALEDINAANAKLTEQEACVDDLRRQLAAEKKLAAIDEVGASRTHRELQGAYDTIRELEAERDRERLKSETTRLARVDEKSGIDGTIKLREMESLHRTMTHEVDMTRQDAERYKSEAHKYKAEYEKHKEEAERLLVDNLKCKAAADRWKSEAEHSRDDAAAKHRSELASRKEECDRLQADCDKARSDLARARAESAEADRLRREAEETRDQRKSEADGLRDEADKLRADANRCKQEADRAKRAHDDLLASNGRAESNECARLKDELQKLKAEGSALRREATAGKGELDRLQNEADAQEFELTRHKDEASRLRTDHARAAAELHRVKLELDHARKLATDAEAETQRLRLAAQTAPERSSMVVTQSSVHNPAVPQQQPVAAGYAEEELLRLAAELRRVNRLKEDALSELDAAQHAAAKAKKAHEAAVSEAEAAEGKVAGLKRAIDDLRADNAELALHLHRAKAAAQEALEEADVASRMLLDARRLAEEAREQLLLNTSRVKRDAEQAEAALHGALAASEAARRGLEASLHESEAVNAATRAKLMEVDRDLSAAVRAATRAEDDLAAEKHRFGLSQAGAADAHAIELNHLRIAHETALTQAEDAARAARREASATQELLQRTTMHFDDQLAKAIRQCEARMELAQHGYDEDVGRARRQKDEAQLAFDAQVQALREACEAQLAGASADLAATRAELQSVVTERDSTREQLVSTQIALAKLQNHAESKAAENAQHRTVLEREESKFKLQISHLENDLRDARADYDAKLLTERGQAEALAEVHRCYEEAAVEAKQLRCLLESTTLELEATKQAQADASRQFRNQLMEAELEMKRQAARTEDTSRDAEAKQVKLVEVENISLQMQRELQHLIAKYDEKKQDLEDLSRQSEAHKEEKGTLARQLEDTLRKYEGSMAELEDATRLKAVAGNELQRLAEENEHLRGQLAHAAHDVEQAHLTCAAERHEHSHIEERTIGELDLSNRKLNDSVAQESVLRQGTVVLQDQLAKQEAAIHRLTQELAHEAAVKAELLCEHDAKLQSLAEVIRKQQTDVDAFRLGLEEARMGEEVAHRRLHDALQLAEGKEQALLEELEMERATRDDLNEQVSAARRQVKQAQQDVTEALEEADSEREALVAQHQARIKKYRTEIDDLTRAFQQGNDASAAIALAAERELAAAEGATRDSLERVEAASRESLRLRFVLDGLRVQCDAAEKNRRLAQSKKELAEQDAGSWEQRMLAAEAEAARLQRLVGELTEKLAAADKKVAGADEQESNARREIERTFAAERDRWAREIRELRRELEDRLEEVVDLSRRLAEQEAEHAHVVTCLRDKHRGEVAHLRREHAAAIATHAHAAAEAEARALELAHDNAELSRDLDRHAEAAALAAHLQAELAAAQHHLAGVQAANQGLVGEMEGHRLEIEALRRATEAAQAESAGAAHDRAAADAVQIELDVCREQLALSAAKMDADCRERGQLADLRAQAGDWAETERALRAQLSMFALFAECFVEPDPRLAAEQMGRVTWQASTDAEPTVAAWFQKACEEATRLLDFGEAVKSLDADIDFIAATREPMVRELGACRTHVVDAYSESSSLMEEFRSHPSLKAPRERCARLTAAVGGLRNQVFWLVSHCLSAQEKAGLGLTDQLLRGDPPQTIPQLRRRVYGGGDETPERGMYTPCADAESARSLSRRVDQPASLGARVLVSPTPSKFDCDLMSCAGSDDGRFTGSRTATRTPKRARIFAPEDRVRSTSPRRW